MLFAGVGILAAIDLLVDGFWRMFYAPGFLQNIMNISVEQADDAVSREITTVAMCGRDCFEVWMTRKIRNQHEPKSIALPR